MAEWKKVLVSGSNIHVNQITASGLTQVSKPHVVVYDTQSGAFHYTASSGVGDNIFVDRTTYYDTINTLRVTGSTLQASPSSSGTGTSPTSSGANNAIYAFLVSESIYSYNHNVGYPTANSWRESLQGSYFNNFDANTNVSEVLRFIAGLLSQSAPDASPNARTFVSYSATVAGTQNTVNSVVPGYIPFDSTNDTVKYLVSRGFSSASQQLFSTYGASTNMYIDGATKFTINYTSGVGGTTTVSSSNDSQLFGLGTLAGGNPSSFTVSASFIHRFFNTQSTVTPTEVSSSNNTAIQTGAGTTAGVTLAKINTVNPAVIPPNFQDGKFVSVLTQTLYSGSSPLTVSASGYYHISSSFRISSGSSIYTAPTSSNLQIFYAPLNLINTTNVPAQTIQTSSVSITHATIASRSLSGAPYLTGSTYIFSSSISRSFSPLYTADASIASLSNTGTGITRTSGVNQVSTAGGAIQTANAVWNAAETVVRGTSAVPFETDRIRLHSLYTFDDIIGSTNVQTDNSGLGTSTFTITATGKNRAGTTTSYSNTINYHTSGTFGQPVSSGSLGYYGRAQGFDSGSISGSRETFVGETFRLKISSSILSGSWANGEKFITASFQLGLGPLDLQVKPSRLIRPGGTYAYWLGDPDSTKDYKFYARAFQTDGTTKSKLTIDIGKIVSPWHLDTATTCSIAVMFESAQAGLDTGGGALARPVLFDPSVRTILNISSSLANDNFRNPFTPLIDLKGNNQTGNDLTGTVYTMPLTTNLNQVLDSTYRNFIVLVRYKNDPSPISYIQIGY